MIKACCEGGRAVSIDMIPLAQLSLSDNFDNEDTRNSDQGNDVVCTTYRK